MPSWRESRRLIWPRRRPLTVCAIRCGKTGRNCPGWRNCLQWLRLALRRWIVGECAKCSGWPGAAVSLAAFVVCPRCVGCMDRLRKMAARCSACPQLIGVMCGKVCSSRLQVDSLTVCTFASVGGRYACWLQSFQGEPCKRCGVGGMHAR